MGSIKEYWSFWLWRDTVTRIITINTIVWIVISGTMLFIPVRYDDWWVGMFALPSSLAELPYRFWTVATYMFSHYNFLHLLVNMLWLLLFGKLLEMILGSMKLLLLYIAGGMAGAAAFLAANTVSPGAYPFMVGASCSVICIATVTAILLPTYKVHLLIFGEVKILWIAIVAIILFVVLEPSLYVSIAHCGGLAAGLAYVLWRRIPKRAKTNEPISDMSTDQQLDMLLAKVSRSGYASLSASERQRLFELSQRIKK